MMKQGVHHRLWDYGITWVCETNNLSVSSSRYTNGRTALEYVTGETPDISEYLDFSFYDYVTFRSNAGLGEISIGRWLGVSHKVGQLMSYWILPASAKVISCTTVQRLTNAEKASDAFKSRIQEYEISIKSRMQSEDSDLTNAMAIQPDWNRLSLDENDEEFIRDFVSSIDNTDVLDASDDYSVQEGQH